MSILTKNKLITQIPTKEYLELLNYKLLSLKLLDDSWAYAISELEKDIELIKNKL